MSARSLPTAAGTCFLFFFVCFASLELTLFSLSAVTGPRLLLYLSYLANKLTFRMNEGTIFFNLSLFYGYMQTKSIKTNTRCAFTHYGLSCSEYFASGPWTPESPAHFARAAAKAARRTPVGATVQIAR